MTTERDGRAKQTPKRKPQPDASQVAKATPETGNPKNRIRIGGDSIEIRPTKLKYMRNHTAAFYRILELYPLADILAMEVGAFEDERDGDQALFDWLVAVTDDADFVSAHYDEMDVDTIEALLAVYRRVNRIDEKEESLKNLTAAGREAG